MIHHAVDISLGLLCNANYSAIAHHKYIYVEWASVAPGRELQ